MCTIVFMPNGDWVQGIEELEASFGIDATPYLEEDSVLEKDQCLCPVDMESYLNDAGATWRLDEPYDTADIVIIMMPPMETKQEK